jgi:enediyne biosynthesis protein E4
MMSGERENENYAPGIYEQRPARLNGRRIGGQNRVSRQTCLILICSLLLAFAPLAALAQATFTKIITGNIVTDVGSHVRSAWDDFNNDGFLDLFISNWANRTNVFYRNNGNGTFTKITEGGPVQDRDYHTGAVWGDYDNDGNLDLLVSAGVQAPTARRNQLYHNNGDGTFNAVSGGGITNPLGFFNGCSWADYDNDGLLDLFITNDGDSNDGGGKGLLFHNDGDGSFTRVTSGVVVNQISNGFGLWADYDNDGFMDLVVFNFANSTRNFLNHNDRDGSFTRVLTNEVATDTWTEGAVGGAWGDYDNDGLLDLFVAGHRDTRNRLYHNNGNGSFTNITSGPILLPTAGRSSGCAWGDYDNDGYLDLFVANNGGQNQLFHNNRDGTFTQVTTGHPVVDGYADRACRAVSWVDYDNDGFLDLFVTSGSLSSSVSLGTNLLYHNNGNTNAWLEVKLVGTVSNRSAIGAKVRVQATIGGKTFWQLREINNGGGYNVVPLVAHFGLGDATNVDLVRIEWPSGIVQTMTNVTAKQFLTIVERQSPGAGTPRFTSVSRTAGGVTDLSISGDAGLLYLFEASIDLKDWSWLGTRTNLSGTFQFTDGHATNWPKRFYRVSAP